MTYTVSRAWHTDLELGTWYELTRAGDERNLIAGFVFVPARKPVGGVDPRSVWDHREVDGSRLPRHGTTLKGVARNGLHARLAGFEQAVSAYRETNGVTIQERIS